MESIYMSKLVDWKIKNSKGIGVELEDIINTENEQNINFPLAYREFLEQSGGYCAAVLYYSHKFEYSKNNQQLAQNLLKEYDLQGLIQKPIWVIATLDGGAFWYIHLDEGDNPPVYRLDCENYGEVPEEMAFSKVADSFQAWIEKAITNYENDPENK